MDTSDGDASVVAAVLAAEVVSAKGWGEGGGEAVPSINDLPPGNAPLRGRPVSG